MSTGSLSPDVGNTCEGREKYWSKIDDKEKIKRLRQVVKQQQAELRRLSASVEILMNHEHGKSGQILSPVRQGGWYTPPGREDNDKVYF